MIDQIDEHNYPMTIAAPALITSEGGGIFVKILATVLGVIVFDQMLGLNLAELIPAVILLAIVFFGVPYFVYATRREDTPIEQSNQHDPS